MLILHDDFEYTKAVNIHTSGALSLTAVSWKVSSVPRVVQQCIFEFFRNYFM